MNKKIPNYIDVKNYLINTLGVDRSVVKGIVDSHVQKMIENRIENLLNETWIFHLINRKINEVLKGTDDGRYTVGPRDCLKEKIEKMIDSEIKRQITDRIKFNEINIDVNLK